MLQKLLLIATVVLAVLKLAGLATISWLTVFAPLIVSFVFTLIVLTGLAVVVTRRKR